MIFLNGAMFYYDVPFTYEGVTNNKRFDELLHAVLKALK